MNDFKSGDSRWFAYDRYVHHSLGCGSYTIFSVSLWICGNGTILTLPERGVVFYQNASIKILWNHFLVSKGLGEEGVTILMSGIFCIIHKQSGYKNISNW